LNVVPLALTVRDITDVVDVHPVEVDREILDSCVFALDEIYLSEANSKPKNNDTESDEAKDNEG
jgi:hypothetical protein